MVSRRLRQATEAQRHRAGLQSLQIASKLSHRLATFAGSTAGRVVGGVFGAMTGSTFGPIGTILGAGVGHQAGRVAGQHLAGMAVNARAMQGRSPQYAAAIGRGLRIGAGGAIAGSVFLGLSLLGERDPEPPQRDVASPADLPLGVTIDGHAARHRLRRSQQWMRGAGIGTTIARGVVGTITGLSDLVHAGIPLTMGPGTRRRAEVRFGELQADRHVAEARATQARMGNIGVSATGGNRAPLADRGSTELHMMSVRRADQVALDSYIEEQRAQKRLEGGVL